MNPDIDLNPQPTQQHVYLLLDPISSVIDDTQVIPLHIAENNINAQHLMPYVQIEAGSLQQLVGAQENFSVEYDHISNEIISKEVTPHYQELNGQASNKPTGLVKNCQQSVQNDKPLTKVVPSSSQPFITNNQIELVHHFNKNPVDFVFETPIKKPKIIHPQQNIITSNCFQNNANPVSILLSNQCFINNTNQSQKIDTLLQNNLDKQIQGNAIQGVNYNNKTSVIVETSSIHPQPVNCTNTTLGTDLVSSEKSLPDNEDKLISTPHKKKKKLKNFVHIYDVKVVPRAVATLPSALQIRVKDKNVFPRRSLATCTRFGPIEGIQNVITQSQANILISSHDGPVFLLKKDNQIIHIDVSDQDKCNWMGLLQIDNKANIWVYQEDQKLYAISTEPIIVRTPLKLGYSKRYADDHGLPSGLPTLDLESVIGNPERWWCSDCNRALPSSALLQRHNDTYHKTEKFVKRRGIYRCRQCKRAFGRIFTLRRHMANHCSKINVKPASEKTSTQNSHDLICSTPNNEENIPSDESFQNFTSGLDFSTSLFDTDKIPNLDISMNSRGDGDFNPYGIELRDDSSTSNDLNLLKASCLYSQNVSEAENESLSELCSYCNQKFIKTQMRRHLRECPSRRLQCCGQLFRNKSKLALHIHKEHLIGQQTKEDHANENKSSAKKEGAFKCDKCKHSFKRRGMLVNHQWRIHNLVSTAPVERPVLHYPCVACPKVYRSSTKRNIHIKTHHPGSEKLRAQSIAGGVKFCEAAACSACPRQYATRAKLMQHVRSCHPQLVP